MGSGCRFVGINPNASPLGGARSRSLSEAGLAGPSLGDAPERCSVPPGITIACTGGGQVDCPGAKFYRLFLSRKLKTYQALRLYAHTPLPMKRQLIGTFVLQSLLSKITTKLRFQSLISQDTILYNRANEETSPRRKKIASSNVTDS